MSIRSFITLVLSAAVVLWPASPVSAVLLTFEDLPATNIAQELDGTIVRNGALTSLSSTISGIGFTIQRRGGAAFDLIENNLQRSKAHPLDFHRTDGDGVHTDGESGVGVDCDRNGRWGRRSLDPFYSFNGNANARSNPFLITFNQPIHVFSVLMGDFGGDLDNVQIRAFTNAAGTGRPRVRVQGTLAPIVGTPKPFTQNHFSFTTSRDIRAVEIVAGSGMNRDKMSVFLDRLFFDPSVVARADLIPFLTDRGVFDEYYRGDRFYAQPDDSDPSPSPVPAPLAATGILALLPWVMFRRYGRAAHLEGA